MSKPQILVCTTPFYGHFAPVNAMAKDLVARGYDVTLVNASAYRQAVEGIGATFVPFEGKADYTEVDMDRLWPERKSKAPGLEKFQFDVEFIFISAIPDQHKGVQKALRLMASKSSAPIVILNEYAFFGMLPTMLGAVDVRPAGMIAIGIIPLCFSSIDVAAFGPGLPPDSSPEGRERNKAMNAGQQQIFGHIQSVYEKIVKELGATEPSPFFIDAAGLLPDRFLQMCIPSAEYPRSDMPAGLRFTGGIPKSKEPGVWNAQPSWWDEIVASDGKKHIILVAQGTMALDYDELLIPTMEGLKDRDDILVVAVLGVRGATLPAHVEVPSNARIHDYIPYDRILPYCSAFVSNGGYGSFQHAIYNAVPLVMAGATEDKPETSARAEWAGMAVNLRTGSPTLEAIKDGVSQVLSMPKYKKRAQELQAEMKSYDPMAIVVETIEELAAGKGLENGHAINGNIPHGKILDGQPANGHVTQGKNPNGHA